MRVLMLHQDLFPSIHNGAIEVLQQLIPKLQQRHIEVFFLTGAHSKKNKVMQHHGKWQGSDCYLFPFLKPKFFHFQSEYQAILKLCQTLKIDVIHAHGAYRPGYLAQLIHKKIGIPYVITSHSDMHEGSRPTRTSSRRRLKNILKHAAWVTHLSPLMKNAANTLYPVEGKSCFIGNGIDLENWPVHRSIENCHYFFGIGRFAKEKGFDILIQAYAQLRKHFPNDALPHLVIAGDGGEKLALENLAQSLNLPIQKNMNAPELLAQLPKAQLIFTGALNSDQKKIWYQAADYFLFAPAWQEVFGLVQLEAMAAEVPLIASKNPATDYLIQQGLSVFSIENNTPESWFEGLKQILSEDKSAQLKKSAEQNKERMKQFSWDHIADDYIKVYDRVIHLRK